MFSKIRRAALSLVLSASSLAAMSAAIVVSGLCVSPAASAESVATGPATTFIKGKHETVSKLLKTSKGAERDKKIDAELATLVDYEEMAKAALGANWEKRSDAERKEFTDLLKQLIEKNYKKRLDQTLDYNVAYKGEVPQGGDTLVKTEASNPKDPRETPVMIDYVLRKRGAGFIVIDVIPEGASTVKTYNKDITKILNKDGWDAVIKKLKDKLKAA